MQWVRGITGFAMFIVPVWLGFAKYPWSWIVASALIVTTIGSLTDDRTPLLLARQGLAGVLTIWIATLLPLLAIQLLLWGVVRLGFG